MEYKYAEKLHNEDEVTIKTTGKVRKVITIEKNGKDIIVMLDDGNLYHHREIR